MALSPTDFYAYSRATGVPVPEDPYEKAKMAPDVIAFRQNQLRAPQQESTKGPDPLSVGLGVGIALAGGLAGGLGLRKLLKGPAKSATTGISQINLADIAGAQAPVRRAATEYAPAPSRVAAQEFTPRSYIEKTGAIAPAEDLTSVQQRSLPQIIDQKINAVESGEDQATGRIKNQLQRNEDYDLTQIEVLEDIADEQEAWAREQDEPIRRVAEELPDGLPVDQLDINRTPTSQEFADIARNEMMAKRQALAASGLRGERLERALGRTPSTSVTQALEAVSPVDIAEAPLQERTLLNIGPEAQLEKAASGTSIRGTSRIGAVAAPMERMRQIGGPDYVVFQGRPVSTVNAPVEMAQDIPGSRRQAPPVPERQDPYALKSDLGGGIGIYGVEPAYAAGAIKKSEGLYQVPAGRTPLGLSAGEVDPMISTTEAAGRLPSFVPSFTEKNNPFRGVSTGAVQTMTEAGTGSQAIAAQRELNRRTRNQQAVIVSEAMRRARLEGRDPQIILDKLMKEQGVSTAAGTFSPFK